MLSARLVPIRRKWANVRGCEQALTVNQIQGRRDAVLVSVATVRRNSTALNQHTECSGQVRPFRSKKWHVESPEAAWRSHRKNRTLWKLVRQPGHQSPGLLAVASVRATVFRYVPAGRCSSMIRRTILIVAIRRSRNALGPTWRPRLD